MFVVHVYPLLRGTPLFELTFFSKTAFPRGSIVDVPIRNAQVPAIVAQSAEAATARSEVRRAGYRLASIPPQTPRTLFTPAFLDAAEQLAAMTAGSVGAILHSLLPTSLIAAATYDIKAAMSSKRKSEELLLQAPRVDRIEAYRTLIREQFAQKRSVLILAPSVREAADLAAAVAEGLHAGRIFLVHGALPKKILKEAWDTAVGAAEPTVIISTISGIGVPRTDWGLIIVEREQSDYYIREARPKADARMFAALYAQALSIPLLSADSVLCVEKHALLKRGDAIEYRPFKNRLQHRARISVIDMREYKQVRGAYPALSRELFELVRATESERSRLFILSGRRGLASSVICKDCGQTVTCPKCEAPISLHTRKGTPVFLCGRCNTLGESAARCKQCASWNLLALGSGSELIEKHVKRITKLPVLRIDSDVAKTPKRAAEIASHFETEPSILIGTELSLAYLPPTLPRVAVTGIDSLLSIPDFSLDERLFSMLSALVERTEKTLLIQTRNPAHQVLQYVQGGDLRGFITRELAMRRTFGFPPYAALITCSLFGRRETVTAQIAILAKRLAAYEPMLLPAHRGARRGSEVVIRVPIERWPDNELLAHIRALPPQWGVVIRS